MQTNRRKFILVLYSVVIWIALYVGGAIGQQAKAQTQSQQPQTQTPADEFQRSLRINSYKVVADSGPARGEVFYYYKCWMCLNKYTIAANPATSAPYLENLFKRKTLLTTGEPVNDDTVTEVISMRIPMKVIGVPS